MMPPASPLPSEIMPLPRRAPVGLRSTVLNPFVILVVSALAAGLVFALWPGLDLLAAGAFYDHAGRFRADDALGRLVRPLGEVVPLTLAALVAATACLRLLLRRGTIARNLRVLAFIGLSLLLGPGLLVNVALKDHSHRPRPYQVTAFGGAEAFRPFYRFDGACRRNCSFVSGEASSATWTAAPALLVPPPWRAPAVATAIVFGAAVGVLRIGFGGHFPSDVVFALILTLAVVFAVHRALRLGRSSP